MGTGEGGLRAKAAESLDVLGEAAHDRIHLGKSESQRGHAWSLMA
jgi:hypothetical protein